jgi:hypothetical protein
MGLEVPGEIGEFFIPYMTGNLGYGKTGVPEQGQGEMHALTNDKDVDGYAKIRFEGLFYRAPAFEKSPGQRVDTQAVVTVSKIAQDIIPYIAGQRAEFFRRRRHFSQQGWHPESRDVWRGPVIPRNRCNGVDFGGHKGLGLMVILTGLYKFTPLL